MTGFPCGRRPGPAGLAFFLVAALVAGCNEDGTGVESDPITGSWVADAADGTLYVIITSDSVVYWTAADAEDCADRHAYGMEPLGSNRYRLSSSVNTAVIESVITARDGELRWDTGAGVAVFQLAADFDPSTLNACAGGADDPALTCSALPQLTLGQEVSGELTETDAVERGRYYDAYGFQPAMQMTGTITLSSGAFDSYLYVYQADGTLITENDDASDSSLDAAVQLQMVPVCYRIEVTSFQDGETGAYTLRID